MTPTNTALSPKASEICALTHLIAANDALNDFADDHSLTPKQQRVFDALRSGADLIYQAALVVASGKRPQDMEFKDLYRWAVVKMIEVERLLPSAAQAATPQWERIVATSRTIGGKFPRNPILGQEL